MASVLDLSHGVYDRLPGVEYSRSLSINLPLLFPPVTPRLESERLPSIDPQVTSVSGFLTSSSETKKMHLIGLKPEDGVLY